MTDKIIAQNLGLGEQVGIISYNETPLKRLILNGLSTISSDFKQMGRSTAELVLSKSKNHIENPFYLTIRNSI